MKKTVIALSLLAAVAVSASAQTRDDEWVGLGTGAYQPGILDYYSDEYPDLMEAAVYESATTPGVYKFVPSAPASGSLVVYDIVVHAENPDKVWCENATYFKGIMNFNTMHKVKEASEGRYDNSDNYGRLEDGVISFSTPKSFVVVEMMGPRDSNLNGKFALYLPGNNPGEDPILKDTWEVMGTGKFVEGLLDCEYNAGVIWDVEIEQSVEHPGCYRLKPWFEGNPSCPELPEVADVYVYIHAENEMEVYTSDFTILNNQGKGYKVQHRAVMGDEPDYSYFGTLEDGIITFPAESHYATVIGIPDAGTRLTNLDGKAAIALPGAKFYDYSLEPVHTPCAKSGTPGFCSFPLSIYMGADVAAVSIAVEAGDKKLEEIDAAYYAANGQVLPRDFVSLLKNFNFPMAADQFNTNRWTAIFVALDESSQPKNTVLTTFFTPEKKADWETYAEASFTDHVVSDSYFAMSETYDVTIERKKGTERTFRIVDPYTNHPTLKGKDYFDGHEDHSHYLYINAEDPEYVYIEESCVGVDMGYGIVCASSKVGNMLNHGVALDEIKSQGVPAGVFKDNEIVFPQGALCFFETAYRHCLLQDGNHGSLLRITKIIESDLEELATEAVEAEYFDLLGVKVATPTAGHIYLRRQGAKTEKVVF